MANNILPYAFTPGTKAKAEEVNANFNALAEIIDSNNSSLNSKVDGFNDELTELLESTSDSKANRNLSDCVCVTNCILEAPNGVLSNLLHDITIYGGLTVLIPNGKNPDGTFVNETFTLENDVTITVDKELKSYYVFLKSDSTLILAKHFIESTIQPSGADTVWLNLAENKMYLSDTNGDFSQVQMVLVGYNLNANISAEITKLLSAPVLSMLKSSDKERIMTWGMPDYEAIVAIPQGWTAAFDAEVHVCTSQANGEIGTFCVNSTTVNKVNSESKQRTQGTFVANVKKGDTVSGNYWIYATAFPLRGVNYD